MSKSESNNPERLEKIERLKSKQINPYPNSFHRTHSNQEALEFLKEKESDPAALSASELVLAGRMTAVRLMGKMAFADIKDSTGRIQLHLSREVLGEQKFAVLKDLDIGDFIGVKGSLFRTKTGEPTLEVKELTVLAKSLHALPEKWHGLVDVEKRFRHRYLDLISNDESRAVFKKRSLIIKGIREYLNKLGFLEVETPVFQQLAGGALARPFITHHNALDEDLYLRIALELYLKRLLVGGFDKVYEIGRVFRNEGLDTKHNPEFTMLESYQAYADYNDVMVMVENMISTVAREVNGDTKVKWGDDIIDLQPPWKRLSLRQAVIDGAGVDFLDYPDRESLAEKMQSLGIQIDPAKDKGRLIDELISTYVEPKLVQPTFLIDYPIEMSPLAKNSPGSDRIVERFEAFVGGGIELANAFSELNDPLEQEKRFQKQAEEHAHLQQAEEVEAIDDDFLMALEYGMPPTGGLGIGIDRLVMLLTEKQSIREVILFPILKSK
jgi:lysyl-tRNA synthetase, class II